MTPTTSFGAVEMEGDELFVNPVDDTWLKHQVEAGLAPQFILGEGQQIILTAPTSELQKFILLHAADADAWDAGDDSLRRIPGNINSPT